MVMNFFLHVNQMFFELGQRLRLSSTDADCESVSAINRINRRNCDDCYDFGIRKGPNSDEERQIV